MATPALLIAPRALLPGDLVLRESPLDFGRHDREVSDSVKRLAEASRLSTAACSFYSALVAAPADTRDAALALPVPDPLETSVRVEFAVASRRLGTKLGTSFDGPTFIRAATLHRYCALPVNSTVDAETGATRDDGAAVYESHSRAAHSCRPNCVSADAPGQTIVASGDRLLRAVEIISQGKPGFRFHQCDMHPRLPPLLQGSP